MDEINTSSSTVETSSEATVNAVDNTNTNDTISPSQTETLQTGTETLQNTETENLQDNNAQEGKDDGLDGDKYAKAFSKRLNKEKEKIQAQYANHNRVIEIAAKQFDMTAEEYINSILEQYSDDTNTDKKESKNDEPKSEKDILLEELLNEKREKELASEWNRQAQALKEINENISIDDISDDMFQLAYDKNIPLEYIYAHHMLTAKREDFTNSIKKEVMKNIEKVNKTAGSMKSGAVSTNPKGVGSMSASEFAEFKERVKRGEVRDF